MALSSQYHIFLTAASADALAEDASIHYVPTLTSINGATAWLKHLNVQEQMVKAKRNFVNVIETEHDLVVETETTLQFVSGGGAYLPGMDDNFLVDRIVTLPMIHIVNFNGEKKIQQVRISWDQGSLLKSVDVIGARGKNWPVFYGNDQLKVIGKSAREAAADDSDDRKGRSRVGANGDKYSSLSLFAPRAVVEREESPSNAVKPRPSAKPAPRDYHDLFAAGADLPELKSPTSPTKENANPVKAGAGKHFNPVRLFDQDDGPVSPDKGIKTNAKKYEHFDFGEAQFVPKVHNKKDRHASQWDFSDFHTPSKPREKNPHKTAEQHFRLDDSDEAIKPLEFRQPVARARPDSTAQFELNNSPGPAFEGDRPTTGSSRDEGLYNDPVLGEGMNENNSAVATSGADGKLPLRNVSNTTTSNPAAHKKTFSSQFEIQDQSPAGSKENVATGQGPEGKARTNKTFQSNWEMRDDSPKVDNGKIKIAGDGMGSRKAADSPSSGGDTKIKIAGDGMGGRKTTEKPWWDHEA